MSNHKNLIFFNKEGDALNFKYNDAVDRFEGDILFHENSSDTYKTYGIYTMERIPSFEFEKPGNLTLEKFQLFNEWGFHFYGGPTQSFPIIQIEPVNNDPEFYSKWIYGFGFENLFPIGTLISFVTPTMEFGDTRRTYCVVGNKNNAIMIISDVDNSTFEFNYAQAYLDQNTFETTTGDLTTYKLFIRAVNSVGIYNYIDSELTNNLSKWNEPNFYERIFPKRKLNVMNTEKNNGVLTVANSELIDGVCFEYFLSSVPKDQNLLIEYINRGDLPLVYNGPITFTNDNKVIFNTIVPDIIKSGTEFKIVGSTLNKNDFMVPDILRWETVNSLKYFGTASQVIFNNKIYETVIGYTQSFPQGGGINETITPLNGLYWRPSTYVPVIQKTYAESLSNAQLYLTTDRLVFSQAYTQSSLTTIGSAVENYKGDFDSLNIDFYVRRGILKADLRYPSKYAEVNFYVEGSNTKIGGSYKTNERLIEVKERINTELNYNLSENFEYRIVFTDIDQFGIKITVNKQIYQEEAYLIYTGAIVDVERSIDKTLRNWLERNYITLHLLGINCELSYIGAQGSPFFNSIIMRTEYPNVPINVNKVEVGSTADFHIEHSRVLFSGTFSIGAEINFKINGKDYKQETVYLPITGSFKQPDIPATLEEWVISHGSYLESFGFIATNINNMMKFDIKRTDIKFEYTVSNGKLMLPGQTDVIITNKIKGSEGALITSNSITLSDTSQVSFGTAGFATGMAVSVNNTIYPYVNQEYNLQLIDDSIMNLSYEGPFWGLTESLCSSSPYVTVAFNSGFGATSCVPTAKLEIGSPFNLLAFSYSHFTKYRYYANYTSENLVLSSVPGSTGMVDLKYVQIADAVFVLADNLIVVDATKYEYTTYINLPGNSNSIKLEYNEYNNYLYCLSSNYLYVVDPVINIVVGQLSLGYTADDIIINQTNGDVYISSSSSASVRIYDFTTTLVNTINATSLSATSTGKMAYNSYLNDVFVTTDGDEVIRIDGESRITTDSYTITGLQKDQILYEPVNESIYVWTNSGTKKIDDGTVYSITGTSNQTFKNSIYNNLTGEVNVSDDSSFKSISLTGNAVTLSEALGEYGFISINQYDGNIYLTSQVTDNVLVVNPANGWIIKTIPAASQCTKIIYNAARKSVWTILPGVKAILEVYAEVETEITSSEIDSIKIDDRRYGTLSDEYEQRAGVWIKSREYLRRPRENFEGENQVEYYWEWYNDQIPQFFLYDMTGEQLLRDTTTYSYTGPLPLKDVPLNKKPNRDLKRRNLPEFQQTVFDQLFHKLDFIDSSTEIDSAPEAIQTFIGFKSEEEGPYISVLQLYKRENIDFFITSTSQNGIVVNYRMIRDKYGVRVGKISIDDNSNEYFSNRGLKPGQLLMIDSIDMTNTTKQYNSFNNKSVFTIKEVYSKHIILDFLQPGDIMDFDSTVVNDWPSKGKKTYLRARFKVIDREIGRFRTLAQTEDEDVRFKIQLNNIGKNISPKDVYIFKDYDILEGGIDWKFLNMKRKEMLMHKHIIYTYVGAYKAIINAINFFGYNDLKLNEYYRNIDPKSKDLLKLFKVEIPDIFDNTVVGWTTNDFLENTMPNEKFEETNLFNLTYDITDREGNYVLNYSIDEVTIKLQGLKHWLMRNVVPLTHRILDITGRSFYTGSVSITHTQNEVRGIRIIENMTPVSFKLTEAYLLPVNSGSTVYNCVLDFYSMVPGVGADKPLVNDEEVMPAANVKLVLPDYFTIKIRTWRTYQEWMPFTNYQKGERVIYFGKLYESAIENNKILDPRKYDLVSEWVSGETYKVSNIVKYKRRTYSYSGLGTRDRALNPFLNQGDNKDWVDITEWFEIDFEPVQTISEYRTIGSTQSGNPITPFNFTIDSNIDPYLTIEVTSENGYGGFYTDKKNYEIRGIKDLAPELVPIEKIGPFQPIKQLNNLSGL